MEESGELERLEREIAELRRELDELERSLPKHSVKPSQMMRIEELEALIAQKEAEMGQLG
jgi:chromosome segregation ATPase